MNGAQYADAVMSVAGMEGVGLAGVALRRELEAAFEAGRDAEALADITPESDGSGSGDTA